MSTSLILVSVVYLNGHCVTPTSTLNFVRRDLSFRPKGTVLDLSLLTLQVNLNLTTHQVLCTGPDLIVTSLITLPPIPQSTDNILYFSLDFYRDYRSRSCWLYYRQ